jgi:hypothetical protein
MCKNIAEYIHHCHTCQWSQTSQQHPVGVLGSLPVPWKPWTNISMNFLTGLLWSQGYDTIWVVVDRLTKIQHFVPCQTTTSAPNLADIFLQHIWQLHRLSDTIISDHGTQFTKSFWQQLCTSLGIQSQLSTAFLPETDGLTERVNAVLKQYFWAYVFNKQDGWSPWLPLAEFATNNHQSETIGVMSFFTNNGCHPHLNFDVMEQQDLLENHDA